MSLSAVVLAAAMAAGPIEQVRDAEIAFAKAFADRDKVAFFKMVADDATFLSPGRTLRGRQEIIDGWSRLLDMPDPPFSWTPDRVSVSADGSLGLSTGPVFDTRGVHTGDYISTWRRDDKGNWKIVFDSTGPAPAPLAENALKIEEGFVTTADGVKLFYRKIGRGPVTAIVPLDYVLFDVVKQLSNVATIITYDPRNRARSTGGIKGATIDDDVRDLEAVRAHFKLAKFVPIGFSYLGRMVLMYAVAHPDRVARVIQLGPLGNKRVEVPFDPTVAPDSLKKWTELQQSGGVEKTPREACVAMLEWMRVYLTATPRGAANFDLAGGCAHENEWPVNVNAHFASLMSKPPAVLTADDLAKVTAPVLTIHGKKDRQAAYEGGVDWVKSLPNARLVTIDNAAHAMWLDEPAITIAAMRQFLRGEWPLSSRATDRASTPTAPDGGGSAPRKEP